LLAADESQLAAAAAAYEETLRAYFGAPRVYALSSGRAAIALGLRALGIGRGDDVAIPAFTCPAVADAVLSLGAITHLVDVSPRHFGLEARSLRRVLARGRTRAAVVAPLFGAVPPQEEIETLLGESGVPWLEDIAQAYGARRGGRAVGSAAPVAVISTNFDKPYTTGRGGVLVVNDAGLAEKVDGLVDALPTQTLSEAELILKGLIISDYLFEAESYRPFISVDLGYLYAAMEGDAYDLPALLEGGAAVAARHALAAGEKLMPERKAPFRKRFFRWFFPSSAVPALGESKRLAPLLAALGGRHLGFVGAEGARRRRLARAWDEIFAEWQMVRGPIWGRAEDEPWPIRYPAFVRSWEKRPEIIRRLAAAGYEAGPFIYPRPLSGQFPYYKLSRLTGRYLRGAWRAAAAVVNLPLQAAVGEKDVLKMAEAMRG
jgi:dTDP-4-amino-4,6-dideoxygalactose transaminase